MVKITGSHFDQVFAVGAFFRLGNNWSLLNGCLSFRALSFATIEFEMHES